MNRFRSIRRRRARCSSGQALVEFGLLVPILLIFVIAVVEFGKVLFTHQVMTNAARDGARRAILADGPSDTEVMAAIKTALTPATGDASGASEVNDYGAPDCATIPPSSPKPASVTVYECGWSGPGTDARVSIQVPYRPLFLGRILHWTTGESTIVLTTSIVMRHE